MGVDLMKAKSKAPSRRFGMVVLLAAASAAVSAALVWSGSSALATVVSVASSSPVRVLQAPGGPETRSSPIESQPAAASHHLHAPAAANASPFQELQAGPRSPQDVGNSPEVSLADAGRAEVGQAAGAWNDRSRNLPKVGKVTPGTILGATTSLGGCLRPYGDAGQCLPSVPPSLARHVQEMKDAGLDPASMPHTWSCGEVRKYFKNGVSVRQTGVDPQELDANEDGIACGPGD